MLTKIKSAVKILRMVVAFKKTFDKHRKDKKCFDFKYKFKDGSSEVQCYFNYSTEPTALS